MVEATRSPLARSGSTTSAAPLGAPESAKGGGGASLGDISKLLTVALKRSDEGQRAAIKEMIRDELSKVNAGGSSERGAEAGKPRGDKSPPKRPPSHRASAAFAPAGPLSGAGKKKDEAREEEAYTSLCSGDLVTLRMSGPAPGTVVGDVSLRNVGVEADPADTGGGGGGTIGRMDDAVFRIVGKLNYRARVEANKIAKAVARSDDPDQVVS